MAAVMRPATARAVRRVLAGSPRERFWSPPTPLGRIAALRVLMYAFLPMDVLLWTPWVRAHGAVPELYRPLHVGNLLHLPTPTSTFVDVVMVALLAGSVLALAMALRGRASRVLGAAVALLYAEWMVIAFSYGKVDHDRFALLVALAVLPTVGAARLGDRTTTEAAGWAVRCIQVAVVATYFLAAIAKFRFGGWEWVNGATLVWALNRRGTVIGRPLLHLPWLLQITQWGIVLIELAAPLLLVLRGRALAAFVLAFVGFHVATYASITILFLPHVICLAAFAPLERLSLPRRSRRAAESEPAQT